MKQHWCGLDWASRTHAVCVVDEVGLIRARFEVPNTGRSFAGLVKRLVKLGVAGVAKHELQTGWFDLLAALRRAGTPYELNPTELMRVTMISSGGVTKRLDRLVEAGLIQRSPDPADRRGTLVRLTRAGKAVIDRAVEPHIANEERLLRSLGEADQRVLDELLRALLTPLEPSGHDGETSR